MGGKSEAATHVGYKRPI